MTETAKLQVRDQTIELPIVVGTEQEVGVDISRLRAKSGIITLDEGYGNTGSCKSDITFIDGEKGILRYRGIPIEQLAANASFIEVVWLLIWGDLPNKQQLAQFSDMLTQNEMLHEGLHKLFEGYPSSGHPMAILSGMINAVSCYHPDILDPENTDNFEWAAARLISKVRTIAAAAYKASIGHPLIYPDPKLTYCQNFLHMMFSKPYARIEIDDDIVQALNLILILHADHEQNCSTSTVRMVASSGANLFASCAAGVCALWGWRHGGANVAVLNMLEYITENKIELDNFLVGVREKKMKLMGFGHRVYKNFDPRAKILKESADKVLAKLGVNDPLLNLARRLEEKALNEPYFVDRNLYPNVDFYSGIIMRAMGLPLNMFTVMFAIGRMPGWIANFKEVREDPSSRISRPRQVYMGPNERKFVPMSKRG